jgi:hypothetical protein
MCRFRCGLGWSFALQWLRMFTLPCKIFGCPQGWVCDQGSCSFVISWLVFAPVSCPCGRVFGQRRWHYRAVVITGQYGGVVVAICIAASMALLLALLSMLLWWSQCTPAWQCFFVGTLIPCPSFFPFWVPTFQMFIIKLQFMCPDQWLLQRRLRAWCCNAFWSNISRWGVPGDPSNNLAVVATAVKTRPDASADLVPGRWWSSCSCRLLPSVLDRRALILVVWLAFLVILRCSCNGICLGLGRCSKAPKWCSRDLKHQRRDTLSCSLRRVRCLVVGGCPSA